MPTDKRIELVVEGDRIVGTLVMPDGEGPHPAAVVGGPMTSVKEQVTGTYARALAKRGIAGLALDHRHYGESEGAPRQYENYHHKVADLKAAIHALEEQTGVVDPDRIGAVGVCLGTGYIVHAAAGEPRVRGVAGVVGYYRDVPAMRAADPDGFEKKVQQGINAREHYEKTGEVITIPAAAPDSSGGDAAMTGEAIYAYYGPGGRADVPNYTNAFAVMSREHFLGFDVQSAAEKQTAPMLMVHCEKGMPPALARSFYEKLTVPKSIHWLDGPNQTAFYDAPELVDEAADLVADHLLKCFSGKTPQ